MNTFLTSILYGIFKTVYAGFELLRRFILAFSIKFLDNFFLLRKQSSGRFDICLKLIAWTLFFRFFKLPVKVVKTLFCTFIARVKITKLALEFAERLIWSAEFGSCVIKNMARIDGPVFLAFSSVASDSFRTGSLFKPISSVSPLIIR